MPPRTRLLLAAAGLLGAAAALVLLRPPPEPTPTTASPPSPSASPSGTAGDFAHTARAYRIAAERPELDREAIKAELTRSDAVVAALQEQGVEGIGDELHRRLNELQPSEAEMLAWFEAHPEHFGDRSYVQSRDVLARLVAIEKVKGELLALAGAE
jgi:hypothetical protein